MPTYNVDEFVAETINSVINQSYLDWELLIVDDCSKDNTREVLAELASKDTRIQVFFSSENNGAGISRNMCIEKATGRFIAFLDSDDLWEKDKLKLQIEHMISINAPVSHTSFKFISDDGSKRKGGVRVSKCVGLISLLKNTEIGTSTAIIDTQLVREEFRFTPIRARQDLRLWIDLLSLGYKSYGLEVPLAKYRVRPNSVSSNKLKMLIITFNVYIRVKALPLYKRVYCYLFYVVNAVKKRKN